MAIQWKLRYDFTKSGISSDYTTQIKVNGKDFSITNSYFSHLSKNYSQQLVRQYEIRYLYLENVDHMKCLEKFFAFCNGQFVEFDFFNSHIIFIIAHFFRINILIDITETFITLEDKINIAVKYLIKQPHASTETVITESAEFVAQVFPIINRFKGLAAIFGWLPCSIVIRVLTSKNLFPISGDSKISVIIPYIMHFSDEMLMLLKSHLKVSSKYYRLFAQSLTMFPPEKRAMFLECLSPEMPDYESDVLQEIEYCQAMRALLAKNVKEYSSLSDSFHDYIHGSTRDYPIDIFCTMPDLKTTHFQTQPVSPKKTTYPMPQIHKSDTAYKDSSNVSENQLKSKENKRAVGLYERCLTFSSCTKKDLEVLKGQLSRKAKKEVIEIIVQIISSNPTLCCHLASYLSSVSTISIKDLQESRLLHLNSCNKIIFLQWLAFYSVLSFEDLCLLLSEEERFLIQRKMAPSPRLAKARQSRISSIVKRQSLHPHEHNNDKKYDFSPFILNTITKLKEESSILYSFVFRNSGILSYEEENRFRVLCDTLFLISPKGYKFLRYLIPTLHSKLTIMNRVNPEIKAYQCQLTMKMPANQNEMHNFLIKSLHPILSLRLGFDPLNYSNPIIVTLGGDAASVYQKGKDGSVAPKNLYNFQIMPIDYHLPTFPIHFTEFNTGAAPSSVRKDYKTLIASLRMLNIDVMFKACDGEPTLDCWFDEPFTDLLTTSFLKDAEFSTVVTAALQRNKTKGPWPVSDPIHLFKCVRAHAQNHMICVDLPYLICVNMELFKQATGLHRNVEDRRSFARMKDSLALEFISYDSWIQCIHAGRFDAAYYIFPFMCLNEAIRSSFMTRKERVAFLEMAYKVMTLHLLQIENNQTPTMFPQVYSSKALGITFAQKSFIKRTLCTIIAIGMALRIDGRVGLHRVGTHCIECTFGEMRDNQYNKNEFETCIYLGAKVTMIINNKKKLGIETAINTRENNGGAKLPSIESAVEELHFNPDFIVNTLYSLLINGFVEIQSLDNFVLQCNSYTQRYQKMPTTKRKTSSIFASSRPLARYLSIHAYRLSSSPIPPGIEEVRAHSPLAFYLSLKKQKDTERVARFGAFMEKFVDERVHKGKASASLKDNESLEIINNIAAHLKALRPTQDGIQFLEFKCEQPDNNIDKPKMNETHIITEKEQNKIAIPQGDTCDEERNAIKDYWERPCPGTKKQLCEQVRKKHFQSQGEKNLFAAIIKGSPERKPKRAAVDKDFGTKVKLFDSKYDKYMLSIRDAEICLNKALNLDIPEFNQTIVPIDEDDSVPFSLDFLTQYIPA